MPKNKNKGGLNISFIKTMSINDICRYAYNFDFTSDNIFLQNTKNDYRLFVLGEKILDTTIAYYIDTKKNPKYIKYTPPSNGYTEKTEFIDQPDDQQYTMSVFGIDMMDFNTKSKISNKTPKIRFGSLMDIVKAAIKYSSKEGRVAHLYSFKYFGNAVLCGFDLIENLISENPILFYSVIKEKPLGFIKYSYGTDKAEFAESVGEHSYMYVKIINLAEPFTFFKDKSGAKH